MASVDALFRSTFAAVYGIVSIGTMRPPFFLSRGCEFVGDLSGGVEGASVRARLATDVLMHVHSCAFVPCSPPRLMSPIIVFSENWPCTSALAQRKVCEPAGVPAGACQSRLGGVVALPMACNVCVVNVRHARQYRAPHN